MSRYLVMGVYVVKLMVDAPAGGPSEESVMKFEKRSSLAALVLFFGLNAGSAAIAQEPATLFDSLDENLNPVSMADMIDGRPLVMYLSSCT